MGWMAEAACKGRDGEMIPPLDLHQTKRMAFARNAKAICAACPVLDECLEYTLAQDELPGVGIWAGRTRDELRALKRARDRRFRRAAA